MSRPVTIALDAQGGDKGAAVCVPAGLAMLRQHPDLHLIFVGQREVIDPFLQELGEVASRVTVQDARQVVGMDEHPADALRKKKDSSMRVAIDLVKAGQADACVSAGNTGALMATARFVLKTLPGIDRPAIMVPVPTIHGRTYMLDLGANSDCTPEHLFQFAVMGSVVATGIENIEFPRIALLNIGEEEIKGNETVKQAAALLSASPLNYVGFIEADRIPDQRADVVVCDGFTGNVALKSMEGTARLVRHFLEQEFRSGVYGRLAGLVALPVLRSLANKLDPRRYNGASLVGLDGIVIKSHGGADRVAFRQAIHTAMIEVSKQVPDQIRRLLQEQAS
ncbi:MAG: phosphate acyltransferase [Gammaproteobacteria bacterium]|nr:MAG: phosphate acyltransferase PlsX [Pseudomonadota bacterium]MBC6944100.1 phosphate acyltransferase PlsX [Gammaproteobacteria bacterium]MCE7896445.1 phosphate acyltransferase PlsX [Gammaproteobacteria bacterium PRO8]MDL1880418.1 phosphate acyltransferase PlsX [Gammaproteobacteria bacterium PRO2]MCL4775954.1 phosphate acyltransferase PlsX [Gammaproteobacteria bacterium]